ncbi:MAG: hypothetical protein AB7E85_04520 [Pseudobdellovibrionaceae bacterium]
MPRTLLHLFLLALCVGMLGACDKMRDDLVAFSDQGMGKDTPPWKKDAHHVRQNDPYMGGVPVVGSDGAVEVNSPVLASTNGAGGYDGPGASETYQGSNTAYRSYSEDMMMRQPMANFAISSSIPSSDPSVTVYDLAATASYASTVYADNAYASNSRGAPRPVVAEVDVSSNSPSIYPSPFRRARMPQNSFAIGRAGDEGTLTPMPLRSSVDNSGASKVSGVTGPKAYMPKHARLTGP